MHGSLIWLLIQSIPSPSPGVSSLCCDHVAQGDQQTAGVLFCWLRQIENQHSMFLFVPSYRKVGGILPLASAGFLLVWGGKKCSL